MKHTVEIEYDDWGGVRKIDHVDICYTIGNAMIESYEYIPYGSPQMTIWRELEPREAVHGPPTPGTESPK